MERAMILVTGATGNVGAHVVAALRGRAQDVRAFVRDADRAREQLGGGVELAVGDFDDRPSLANALDGVDAVFLTSSNGPLEVAHETAVIDAAGAAGAAWLVKLSALGAKPGSPLPALDWHGQIEDHLRRSGLPAAVLQANFFMTNVLPQEGRLVAPAGGARISMIDPRDVAEAAAALLAGAARAPETVVLTGGAAITYEDVAAELSAVSGQRVEFVDVPAEAARQGMAAAGLPEWLVEHLSRLFAIARDGALAEVTDGVRALTGRRPRTFAEFARDHAARFTVAETV